MSRQKNDLSTLPEFRSGDVVFFSDDSWVSKAIRWFEPGPSKASHVGVMVDGVTMCEALAKVTIQAVGPRLRRGWREVWRFGWVEEADAAFIEAKCKEFEGRSYGWWKVIFHALGLQRLTNWSKYPICSFLVASIMNDLKKAKTGDARAEAFGVSRGAAQPDNMHDYMVESLDETFFVWTSTADGGIG